MVELQTTENKQRFKREGKSMFLYTLQESKHTLEILRVLFQTTSIK